MTGLERGISAGVTGALVFFAVWGLIAVAAIASHAGLAAVTPGLFAALAAGTAACAWEWRRAQPSPPREASWAAPSPPVLAAGLLAAGLTGLLPFIGPWQRLAWGTITLLVAAVIVRREGGESAVSSPSCPSRFDGFFLAVAVLVAISVTVLSNRPQPEDYRYLWMLVRQLHHPDWPILDLFTVTPGRQEVYVWHPREVLLAALQRQTGVSILTWYYYVLPILHAALTTAVLYLCAQWFTEEDAAKVTALCVLLLVAWGEAHTTFGNFSFARMFHGQAAQASWAAPAAFLFGLRFGRERSLGRFLLLTAAVLSAFVQWHTGAVVGPLAAVTGALAAWPCRGRAQAPLLALGLLVAFAVAFQIVGRLAPAYHILNDGGESAVKGLAEVFPPDFRSGLAMTTAALAGLALHGEASRLATRAFFFGLVFCINPYVRETLSHAVTSLSFRLLWAFPFVLFLGLGLAAAARLEMRRWRMPVVSAAALALFLMSGLWITAADNANAFGDYGYKILPHLREWVDSGADTPPSLAGTPIHVPGWSH